MTPWTWFDRAALALETPMTIDEARAIVFSPLPDFEACVALSSEAWGALVAREMEALRVLYASHAEAP